MRQKKRFFPQLLLVIGLGMFLFAGCYTQFQRPHVDTDDGYYIEEETPAQVDEGYQEEQNYDYDQQEPPVVNYNYYNNNYFYDPFYDPWYTWYVGYYYPQYYGYFYTGFYPWNWWDPYYHPYYPGWYFSYYYGGYYSYAWWEYDRYWYGSSFYLVSDRKQKRSFTRRSLSELNRESQRRQGELVRKPRATEGISRTGDEYVNKTDGRRGQLEPDRQVRPVSRQGQAIAKPVDDAISNRNVKKTPAIDRRRMTIVRPEGKIIKRRPTGKTTIPSNVRKVTVRKPQTEARPSKTVQKPSVKKSRNTTPKITKPKSKTPRITPKKSSQPRIKRQKTSSSYRPRLKTTTSRTKTSNIYRGNRTSTPSRSYTRPTTNRSFRTYSSPTINRSSGSVSRPAPTSSSRSSSSSSKSSGSKSKKN